MSAEDSHFDMIMDEHLEGTRDEWKRRALIAEECSAELRKELHEERESYIELLALYNEKEQEHEKLTGEYNELVREFITNNPRLSLAIKNEKDNF